MLPREATLLDGSPAGLSLRVRNEWCVERERLPRAQSCSRLRPLCPLGAHSSPRRDEPHAGVAEETFTVVGNVLEVVTKLETKGKLAVSYRAIYRKRGP